jgi:hypothetical protein
LINLGNMSGVGELCRSAPGLVAANKGTSIAVSEELFASDLISVPTPYRWITATGMSDISNNIVLIRAQLGALGTAMFLRAQALVSGPSTILQPVLSPAGGFF